MAQATRRSFARLGEAIDDGTDVQIAELGMVAHRRIPYDGPADYGTAAGDLQTGDPLERNGIHVVQCLSVPQPDHGKRPMRGFPKLVGPGVELGNRFDVSISVQASGQPPDAVQSAQAEAGGSGAGCQIEDQAAESAVSQGSEVSQYAAGTNCIKKNGTRARSQPMAFRKRGSGRSNPPIPSAYSLG